MSDAIPSRVRGDQIIERRIAARTATRREYAALDRYRRRQLGGFYVNQMPLVFAVMVTDIHRSMQPYVQALRRIHVGRFEDTI